MWALDPDCLGSNPDFTYNYLHEVSKWLKFSVSWFYHPLNGNNNSTYYIGILWGFNEVTYVTCLHLAPGKCGISISYFSSQIHSLESIFQKTQKYHLKTLNPKAECNTLTTNVYKMNSLVYKFGIGDPTRGRARALGKKTDRAVPGRTPIIQVGGRQAFSVKDLTVTILSFSGHTVATLLLQWLQPQTIRTWLWLYSNNIYLWTSEFSFHVIFPFLLLLIFFPVT